VSKDRQHVSALFYKAVIKSDMEKHFNTSLIWESA